MLGATPTWPPPDTDRNRFLFRLGFPLGVLASAYVLAFALLSQGWLPFVVAVLLIAGTLMLGIGLLLMRRQRRHGGGDEAGGDGAGGDETDAAADDGDDGPGPTPRPRPRPAPIAR
ncbi:hypothetical protein LQ327_24995 [Actinomycetospora endophytica]|uniref:DUF3040 family protein n=1 Tax=Actinomycetospora endophytica TaxID=2291215 RepID=A0ABS8PEC1_9PSEU|nr:hypothetical protein [Actinomycetospora endophytica]MCD2196635.1 hypothetical protein [Actinomycetospora endophytica]